LAQDTNFLGTWKACPQRHKLFADVIVEGLLFARFDVALKKCAANEHVNPMVGKSGEGVMRRDLQTLKGLLENLLDGLINGQRDDIGLIG
jgi:hypothetical protein